MWSSRVVAAHSVWEGATLSNPYIYPFRGSLRKDQSVTPSVKVDRDGLHLNGEPFYLLAGCVHYFRWPRAEWRPLLEQARRAGLNTIDTVIPWNRHESHPGVFDFHAEADLGAFLDLCHELGLKAIVRPGPYICAEWDNGGIPAWLSADPAIRLRVDSPGYLARRCAGSTTCCQSSPRASLPAAAR